MSSSNNDTNNKEGLSKVVADDAGQLPGFEEMESSNKEEPSQAVQEVKAVEISFGPWLKGKREEQKVSLEEIAAVTKIHITQLKNLESDRFEQLPATAFVRGFLVNYARHIGADETEVLTRFQNAVLGKRPGSQLIVPPGNKAAQSASRPKVRMVTAPDFDRAPTTEDLDGGQPFYSSYKFWLVSFVVLSLVGLIIFLINIGKNPSAIVQQNNKPAVAEKVEAATAPVAPSPAASPVLTGSAEMGPALPPVKAPVAAAVPSPSPAVTVAASPVPAPKPSKPVLSEAVVKAQAAVAQGVAESNKLEIRAVESSWVNVKSDEKESQGMLMESGKSYAFGANKKVVLSLSNAGAVEIRWNGKWYKAPGYRGDVKSLVLPDQLDSLTAK